MALRAVIVDDSPLARRIIRHHLVKLGCKVVGEAETAAQAVKVFQALKPELITLDVMMPEVDGYDAMRAFLEIKSLAPATAIVVVSAVPFGKVRENFLAAGALDYIVKPFNQFSFEPVRQKLVRVFRDLASESLAVRRG
ncbi:MAG TPA: response regulator [Candidatus Binataceae bacterium]|nr:response regulator [Candidatus Binataceae bacterium]